MAREIFPGGTAGGSSPVSGNTAKKTLLVLGVGNLLLTDDGAGVHAVRALAAESWPEGVEFMDAGTAARGIVHRLTEFRHLLVLDAVRFGRPPGTVGRWEEAELSPGGGAMISMHDLDIFDLIATAELIGDRPVLHVVGIEPENLSDWDMSLSPILRAAFPDFLAEARSEIRRILEMDSSAIV